MKKIIVIVILFLLILTAFSYLYFSQKIHTVVDGRIYRSAQLSHDDLERIIKEKGIKSILNLRGEADDSRWYVKESEIARRYHVKLYNVGISATELPEYRRLADILDILLTSERPVLIHCYKGVDRTGMVSALALSIENDPTLSELKEQFSMKYGVLPFSRSTGPSFFSIYEQWLSKTHHVHNKNNLIYWIRNEYRDSSGNLRFWIDHVNWKIFKDGKVTIPDNTKSILIGGWAFDTRTLSSAGDLYVIIDDRISLKTQYLHNRPDVAKAFQLGEPHYQHFVVGWEVESKRDEISSGCHTVSLRIIKDKSDIRDIPEKNIFCFE